MMARTVREMEDMIVTAFLEDIFRAGFGAQIRIEGETFVTVNLNRARSHILEFTEFSEDEFECRVAPVETALDAEGVRRVTLVHGEALFTLGQDGHDVIANYAMGGITEMFLKRAIGIAAQFGLWGEQEKDPTTDPREFLRRIYDDLNTLGFGVEGANISVGDVMHYVSRLYDILDVNQGGLL